MVLRKGADFGKQLTVANDGQLPDAKNRRTALSDPLAVHFAVVGKSRHALVKSRGGDHFAPIGIDNLDNRVDELRIIGKDRSIRSIRNAYAQMSTMKT